MKSSELRSGNWVQDIPPYDEYFKVTPMNILKQACGQGYRPIPLTRERVESMGFENNGGVFSINTVQIQPITGESEWELVDDTGETISCPFKYVHQLQNLYFALTNEELIFKR